MYYADSKPLIAGSEYIRFLVFFHQHINYQLSTMLKIKREVKQQDF